MFQTIFYYILLKHSSLMTVLYIYIYIYIHRHRHRHRHRHTHTHTQAHTHTHTDPGLSPHIRHTFFHMFAPPLPQVCPRFAPGLLQPCCKSAWSFAHPFLTLVPSQVCPKFAPGLPQGSFKVSPSLARILPHICPRVLL